MFYQQAQHYTRIKKKVQPEMNRYSVFFIWFGIRTSNVHRCGKNWFQDSCTSTPVLSLSIIFRRVNDLLRILWLHFTSFAYKSMLWRWQTKWMDIFKSDCRTHTNRMHIHWLTRTRLSISLLTPHFRFLDLWCRRQNMKIFIFVFFFSWKRPVFIFKCVYFFVQ